MAESKACSVVTIPLKTEKWQEDKLNQRMDLCRKVYNNMVHDFMKEYKKMLRDKSYNETKDIILSAYKTEDEKEKKKIKASAEYKEAVKANQMIVRDYKFSEFGIGGDSIKYAKVYSENISSTMANLSIGKPLWTAFERMLYGNGEIVHYKKYGDLNSIATDGKSGIRILDENNKTVKKWDGTGKLYCVCGTNKGKVLRMPLKIDKKDLYKLEMLTDRTYKIVRITRKLVNSVYKYYVQITVEGAPALRYNNNGELKNGIGSGKVGIYIDTNSITCYKESEDKFYVIDLTKSADYEDKRNKILQEMDYLRRKNNPDNYNSDGTVKKGIVEDGKRHKLKWVDSKKYKQLKFKLSNLYRIEQEQRKLDRQNWSNQILSLGDQFFVNDYPFQYASERLKFSEEDEKTESGKFKKKSKKGKDIGKNAPATLITLLDQKIASRGKETSSLTKIKLKNIDYSEGYRKFYAKKVLDNS